MKEAREIYQTLISSLRWADKMEIQAVCPLHDDTTPSLSINTQTGLWYCHRCNEGGKPISLYMRVKGVDFKTAIKDLDGGHAEARGSRIIKTYDYTNEAGILLFQVVRMEPKTFRQRRPDGNGGWIWNTEGVRIVPYNLHEVLKSEIVFVVEGEKDVETLRNLGLTATTNPRGAGKWRPEFNEYFKDKEIVLLPDNDQPGRDHAQNVARNLYGIVRSVKIVELPELPKKEDISDWVKIKGNDKARLLEIIKDAPVWTPESANISGVVKLKDVTPEIVSWLWDGYIPLGKVTLLDGDPGTGKSTISLDIAAKISTGSPLPDGACGIKGGVVLLSLEDGLADTIRPRLEAMGADLSKIVALQGVPTEDGKLRFPTIEDIEAITRACQMVKAKLVIIDPLMGYLGGHVNSHRDQDIRQAMGPIVKMAEELGVAVLVIRHLNKSGGNQSIYRGGGSIGIIGAARVALLVAKDPQDETKRVLAGIKNNLAPLPVSLSFHIEGIDGTSRIVWEGVSTHTADGLLAIPVSQEERSALEDAEDFLRDMLAESPVDSKEILKEARNAGVSEKTLHRAKKTLGVRSQKLGFGRDGVWVWALKDGQDMPKMVKEKGDHLRGDLTILGDNEVIEVEGELCDS